MKQRWKLNAPAILTRTTLLLPLGWDKCFTMPDSTTMRCAKCVEGWRCIRTKPGFYWDVADVLLSRTAHAGREHSLARRQALSLENDPNVTALGEAYKRSGYKGYLLKQAEFEHTHNAPYSNT